MSNQLPILKNRKEEDIQKQRGMFVDQLFGSEHSPILMYGVDNGSFMEYSQSNGDDEDKQIKEQSIKNLENLDVPYQVQEMQGFKIAMAQHEYAAEKILDKSFMKRIAADLGTNSIVVGIPMKGFMAAVAKGSGEAKLYGAIVQQYQNAETYPISDAMYYVVDGEIEMMGGNHKSNSATNENEVFEVSGRNDSRGKLGFVAKVGNKSEDELANQIQTAFQNILLHGMKDAKNFNGKIDFHISPTLNALTPSLEERLKKMAKNISERGAVQIMGGLSGEEFKVRFFHGEGKLIAETEETKPVQVGSQTASSDTSPADKVPKPNETKIEKKPWWKFW